MKALAILSAVVAMFVVCFVFFFVSRFPGYRGPVYDSWGSSNGTFQVRITAYKEVGIMMPGAFFTFESAPMGSDEWRAFKDFRADDRVRVSLFSEKFRFVNANTAYLTTHGELLITKDSGRTWSAWRPVFAGSEWSIRDARIESDGTGKASLSRYDDQKKEEVNLNAVTRDYGQNWAPH